VTSNESEPSSNRVAWRFSALGQARLVRLVDVVTALGLIFGYLATFVTPRRLDPWIAHRLSSLFLRFRAKNVRATEAFIRRVCGPRAGEFDVAAAAQNYYRAKFEYAVGRVRGMHPRHWDPQIEVEGLEHLESALEHGHGAILWRTDMGDTLVLQRAMWQSGHPLVQLSSAGHGATNSYFSYRVTAPLYARAENAYLRERVTIPSDWSYGYLPHLMRELKANHVVAILGELVGRQNVHVSVFGKTRVLATGAPAIAHRTGAALIPVATSREGPWRYRIRLGAPIEVDRSVPRRTALDHPTRAYARFIEEAVIAHPGDYNAWWSLMFSASDLETNEGMRDGSSGSPA
jgi:lauroyl/myristoyl acyltransferase